MADDYSEQIKQLDPVLKYLSEKTKSLGEPASVGGTSSSTTMPASGADADTAGDRAVRSDDNVSMDFDVFGDRGRLVDRY